MEHSPYIIGKRQSSIPDTDYYKESPNTSSRNAAQYLLNSPRLSTKNSNKNSHKMEKPDDSAAKAENGQDPPPTL